MHSRATTPITSMMMGNVYFVSDGTAIKIGFSGAPAARLTTLQISHHAQLTMLGYYPGNERDEAQLHQRFAHLHIRGEWFRAEPELFAYIEQSRSIGPLIRLASTIKESMWRNRMDSKEARRRAVDPVRQGLREFAVGKSEGIQSRCSVLWAQLGGLVQNPHDEPLLAATAAMVRDLEREVRRTA